MTVEHSYSRKEIIKAQAEIDYESGERKRKELEQAFAVHDFIQKYGISPEKCKELMERVAEIVNQAVSEVIEHADFYIDPLGYEDEEFLKEEYGEDALEKDENSDGYPNIYDFKKENSAEMLFMNLISYHTHYGGHTSAIEACKLMGIEGWRK